MDNLDKWDLRYIQLAKEIAQWSSCLSRKVGCVITKERRIVATGYNGAPSGIPSCFEKKICLRKNCKSGEDLHHCWGIHAEQNAIAQLVKLGTSLEDKGCLYVTTFPCESCMKLIIASGIKRIVYLEDYNSPFSYVLSKEAHIKVLKIE